MIEKLHLQNNVILKGYVDQFEKFRLIAESNALMFPSMCEGFGLVILEAFQQKRPVLVSNIPPLSEIVEDGKTGYVLNPQDEKEWAKKIIHLIFHQKDSMVMGQNAFLVLKENYSHELFYNEIIKMYKSVLQNHKK